MKIYINARFLTQQISGVQRYGIECCRQIKKLYADAVFLAPQNIIHHAVAHELGVTLIGNKTGHIWEQTELLRFMKKTNGAPLLNLCNTAPLLYHNNYLTLHDLAFYWHPEWNSKPFAAWYNFLIPRLARASHKLFTVSSTVKTEIEKAYGIDGHKIEVTYNGISLDFVVADSARTALKERLILSVGSFNIRKNHQTFIQGFLNSPIQNEYRLVIVGAANGAFAASKENGLPDNKNVTILSDVSHSELQGLYQKAEIVASLSLYEGFGIPLVEGLHFGCKLLCSDIPVYHELFGDVAVFCSTTNVADVARNIEAAIAAPYRALQNGLCQKYSYEYAANVILRGILSNSK
jgi:glycosyltransferase involved in cell wall biosynthesis